MKAKKIVAIVMGTTIAATMAVGLTACGGNKGGSSLGTTTVNLTNYAEKYESGYSHAGYTAAQKVLEGNLSAGRYSNFITVEKEGKYSVYDLLSEKYIFENKATIPVLSRISSIGGDLDVWKVQSATDAAKYTYYDINGQEILAEGVYGDLYINSLNLYVGNETQRSLVYTITGTKTDGETESEVLLYLKKVVDKETEAVSYVKINQSDIRLYSPEYIVGSELGVEKESVYPEDEEYPVEGEIKNYKYSQLGNVLTFYNGETKTGSVDLTSRGEPLGFVGNSFYYSTMTPYVPEDHSGYNYIFTESGEFKFNYSLYKYDIIQNKTTELNYNVGVVGIEPVYNHETKAYDAAIIVGYKMTDGVVSIYNLGGGSGMGEVDVFNYFVTEDFKIAYDMTGIIEDLSGLYDIGNDKYYVRGNGKGYVVDGSFNVLSDVGTKNVIAEEGLVVISEKISTGSENIYVTGFADLNGKVVVAPEYMFGYDSSLSFYGGYTAARNIQGEQVLIKNDGTVTNLSALEKSTDENVKKTLNVGKGYYSIVTTTKTESGTTIKKDYYSFNGTLLKSFDHSNVEITEIGDDMYIIERVTGTDLTTTTTYYKLV